MIGVVDYEAGNIASVRNALAAIQTEFVVSGNPAELAGCSGIVLPGVGAAPTAMSSLSCRGLVGFLRGVKVPLLGICLGMQLLYECSEEGPFAAECLGIVQGSVTKLDPSVLKIPHMGWNRVDFDKPIFEGFPLTPEYYYFAHSYAAPVNSATVGTAECGVRIAAAVRCGNYYGVQFHPEKSGAAGLRLLKHFVSLCASFPR